MFPLKYKNDYKLCVIFKEVCSCGSRYVGETKRNQKLDGINIIIQLNVQDHQNTLNAKSSTALHGLSFQMLQKMQRPGIASKPHIFFSENLILNEEKDFERLDLFRNGVT